MAIGHQILIKVRTMILEIHWQNHVIPKGFELNKE